MQLQCACMIDGHSRCFDDGQRFSSLNVLSCMSYACAPRSVVLYHSDAPGPLRVSFRWSQKPCCMLHVSRESCSCHAVEPAQLTPIYASTCNAHHTLHARIVHITHWHIACPACDLMPQVVGQRPDQDQLLSLLVNVRDEVLLQVSYRLPPAARVLSRVLQVHVCYRY